MEKEVSFDPVHIRLLCANTVVFNSDTPAKLVQQLRRVRRSFGCGVHDQYRSYRTRWTITINRLAHVARLSTKTYNTFTPTNVVDITLGALISEKYGRFSFMQTPSRTIEQIATHFIRTLRNERQASSQVRALASTAGVGPTCRSTRTPEYAGSLRGCRFAGAV